MFYDEERGDNREGSDSAPKKRKRISTSERYEKVKVGGSSPDGQRNKPSEDDNRENPNSYGYRDRNYNSDRNEGGGHRERNFNSDRGDYNRDRNFNSDKNNRGERSGGGGFNRNYNSNREGGGYRERNYNSDRSEGGGGYRERNYNSDRNEGGGYRERNYNSDRSDRGDRGGYSRERNYNSDRSVGGGGYRERNYNSDRGDSGNRYGQHNDNRGGFQKKSYGTSKSYGNDNRGGFQKSYNRQGGGGFSRPGVNKSYGGRSQQPYRNTMPQRQPEYHFEEVPSNEPIRLNKYIANTGLCSRREADEHIKGGLIMVNDKVVTELGVKVLPTDEVKFNGNVLIAEKKVYILLNKPKDYVTSVDDPHAKRTIMELVRSACKERIYPVGRLDRMTTGVILLTNDGELTKKLTHPTSEIKKIYHVTLDKNAEPEHVDSIADGITLEDGFIKVDNVGYLTEDNQRILGIEIHSGRNRIVRRIFEHFGYKVIRLDRIFFGGLTKKGLSRGKWRYLGQKEVGFLKMLKV